MDLKRLLKGNVLDPGIVEYEPSPRITNEDGTPGVWLLRALTNEEVDAINERCTTVVKDRKTGQVVSQSVNLDKLSQDVLLQALVEPSLADLEDGDIQDSWGAYTPYDVLRKMLKPGELAELGKKVQEICGYNQQQFTELVGDIEKK